MVISIRRSSEEFIFPSVASKLEVIKTEYFSA
jgi:hypothetical protein